jgi:hypothetical protein
MLSMTNLIGESYSAKLDGTEAPYNGDPGISSVLVRKLSKGTCRTLSVIFQLSGLGKVQSAAKTNAFAVEASQASHSGRRIFQSAESAIEFGRRLQRHQIAGLKNRGVVFDPHRPYHNSR